MEPIKPANDVDRQYRYIVLENELAVLLVSDATTKIAAAAVDIQVGAYCDPDELPGLAHFLEHMLFMGSSKYPNENEYDKFLAAHGGETNAYTSDEHTTFHFSVEAPHLAKALDIMGAIFAAPLMDPSTTERELLSVHSEDKKCEKTDSWRYIQVMCECANQQHPKSKFIGGNKTSLDTIPKTKGIDVRKALLAFHDKYYSSNLMKVAIAGPQSLEELESMARTTFAPLVNKKVPLPTFGPDAYLPEHLGKEVFIETIKNITKLELRWPVPSYMTKYAEASLAYLSHLIGHEAEGSLLAHLKALGWATELAAGPESTNREFDSFYIDMDLTKAGFAHHRYEIVKLAYEYIDMLLRKGPQEWIFNEIKMMNKLDFDNLNKKKVANIVTDWVENMSAYPPQDILRGPWAVDTYNPKDISEILSFLRPDNMLLVCMSKPIDSITYDKREKWYGVPYHVRPLASALMQDWTSFSAGSTIFHLPKPNLFIPSVLLVHPLPSPSSVPSLTHSSSETGRVRSKSVGSFEVNVDPLLWSEPEKIVNTLVCDAWHLQDPLFAQSPKLSIRLMLHSQATYATPNACVYNRLYCTLVMDSLSEELYDATIAGIDFDVASSFEGILIMVNGYADKLAVLLKMLLDRIVNLKPTKERFDVIKQTAMRGMYNFGKSQPWNQAQDYLDTLICQPRWGQDEKYAALALADLDDVLYHKKAMLKQNKLEMLLIGNLTRQGALSLVAEAQKLLIRINPLYPSQFSTQRTIALPAKTTVVLEKNGLDSENPNAAVFVWYEACAYSDIEAYTLLELGSGILYEPIYDTLRTKEQLGYLVWSGIRTESTHAGFRVTIQSSDYSARHLLRRIDDFLHVTAPTLLSKYSDTDFRALVQAELSQATEKPGSINSRTNKFWEAIEDGSHLFLRKKKVVEFLQRVSKVQVIDFMQNLLSNFRRAVVLVNSSAHNDQTPITSEGPAAGEIMVVQDLMAFKNASPLHDLAITGDKWRLPEKLPEPLPSMILGDDGDESMDDMEEGEEEENEEGDEEGEEEDEGEEDEEHDE